MGRDTERQVVLGQGLLAKEELVPGMVVEEVEQTITHTITHTEVQCMEASVCLHMSAVGVEIVITGVLGVKEVVLYSLFPVDS